MINVNFCPQGNYAKSFFILRGGLCPAIEDCVNDDDDNVAIFYIDTKDWKARPTTGLLYLK